MARSRDFLDEIIEERTRKNPRFPERVESALDRRKLLRQLAAARERAGISQTLIAARMGTSQSAVARIETGEADVKLSTVDRYASAVGKRLSWTLKTSHALTAVKTRTKRTASAAKSGSRTKARAARGRL